MVELILRIGEDLIFGMCLGVKYFALATNVEFRKLGWLEWRWLEGIYSPNHYSSRCWRWRTGQDTVQCPVRATSAARWGLERLTVEALCPVAAPDSPVAHRTCPVRSDFAALTSDSSTVCFYCSRSRLLSAGDHCSIGSIIVEWLPERPESG